VPNVPQTAAPLRRRRPLRTSRAVGRVRRTPCTARPPTTRPATNSTNVPGVAITVTPPTKRRALPHPQADPPEQAHQRRPSTPYPPSPPGLPTRACTPPGRIRQLGVREHVPLGVVGRPADDFAVAVGRGAMKTPVRAARHRAGSIPRFRAPPMTSPAANRCCDRVASARAGRSRRNSAFEATRASRNPPPLGMSFSRSVSQPRSVGKPPTASPPAATNRHSASGSPTPPGKRHPSHIAADRSPHRRILCCTRNACFPEADARSASTILSETESFCSAVSGS